MATMPVTYTCSRCGGTFTSDWTDEDAAEEAKHVFGEIEASKPMSVVCDVCYREMGLG